MLGRKMLLEFVGVFLFSIKLSVAQSDVITAQEANKVIRSFPDVCGDFGYPDWDLVPLQLCGQQICWMPRSVCAYHQINNEFRCYAVPLKCQDRIKEASYFLSDDFKENQLPPEGNIYEDADKFDVDATYPFVDDLYSEVPIGNPDKEIEEIIKNAPELPPLPDGFFEPPSPEVSPTPESVTESIDVELLINAVEPEIPSNKLTLPEGKSPIVSRESFEEARNAGGSGGSEGGIDWHKNCCFWALYGECPRNPRFMLSVCQKSCGTFGCKDSTYQSCAINVNTKECNHQRQPWFNPVENISAEKLSLAAPVSHHSSFENLSASSIGLNSGAVQGVFSRFIRRLRERGVNVVPVSLHDPVKK